MHEIYSITSNLVNHVEIICINSFRDPSLTSPSNSFTNELNDMLLILLTRVESLYIQLKLFGQLVVNQQLKKVFLKFMN